MIHNHTTVTGLRRTQMTQPRDVEEDQVIEVLIQHTIQSTELMTPIFHHCRQTHDMIAGVICQVPTILNMVQQWTEVCNQHVLTRPNLPLVEVRMVTLGRVNNGQLDRLVKAKGTLHAETLMRLDRVVEV